jgi:hypothetical protein
LEGTLAEGRRSISNLLVWGFEEYGLHDTRTALIHTVVISYSLAIDMDATQIGKG